MSKSNPGTEMEKPVLLGPAPWLLKRNHAGNGLFSRRTTGHSRSILCPVVLREKQSVPRAIPLSSLFPTPGFALAVRRDSDLTRRTDRTHGNTGRLYNPDRVWS